jgi:hypothetical protein
VVKVELLKDSVSGDHACDLFGSLKNKVKFGDVVDCNLRIGQSSQRAFPLRQTCKRNRTPAHGNATWPVS